VDHLETPDPYTIRVVLKDVSSTFLPSIDGIETFSVIPKDSLEPGIDKPAAFPPGTGSFMFVSWTPRQSLVFDRFADYWGQKAYVDRVVLKPVEDATVRINALRSGDVDLIERAPYEWVQQIKEGKLAGISMSEAPTAGYRRIVFNWADAPFNNPKLRQAFAYGIDMKEVLQAAYFGLGEIADQKYPKGHQWYIDGVPSFSYDPERAKALLVEAGYNGEPINMVMENAADVTAIATTMQAQLKRIGVNLSLQPMEFAAQRDLVIKGQFSFDFMGSNYYDDPFTTYAELLCEDPRNRISNYAGYCNPEVDALLHQIQHELDVNRQKELLKQVLTKRYEESPHATGVFVPRFYAFRDVVRDFKTDDDQNLIWMSGGLNYAWLDN
jgi:ABC-type transport system substrate-binding protein